MEDRTPFITIYLPVAGWKAVMYWWNEEDGGFWEPWETSPYAFSTPEGAERYGRMWARNENVRFVERK